MKHAVSRSTSAERPDDADEHLEERFEAALAKLDEDIGTDGGVECNDTRSKSR
jgi:hypothetical protein